MANEKIYHHNRLALFNPLNLPSWLSIGLLKTINLLPLNTQRKIGSLLGKAAFYLLKDRKKICLTNIKLCFPNLDASKQKELVKHNFKYLGIGFIESGLAWFAKDSKIENLVEIKNNDFFKKCQKLNNGILLLAPHNYCLEICGRIISKTDYKFVPTFRHIKNPVLNYIMQTSRTKNFDKIFYKSDLRKVIKSLKNNEAIWNAADQDFGREHSVFAPFFGITTATITSPKL